MGQAAEANTEQSNDIAVYQPFRNELAKLKADNDKLIFQYHTPKGNKEARSHIYNLRKRKADIERARKAEKASALEYGRQVDAQAKEIASEYDAMIDKHQAPLDEIERIEAERVAAHNAKISELAALVEFDEFSEPDSAELSTRLEAAQSFVVDDSFEEFQEQANAGKTAAIEKLSLMLEARQKYEAEQAELERLRAEAAKRQQQEREDRIAREAAERAQREAEEKARLVQEETERKARAEKEAAERREQDLRDAAAKAEREAKEQAERAERAAQEATERAKREAEHEKRREQEEAERRERNKRHKASINNKAVDALVAGGMDKEQAKLAVTLIAKREIPSVTISY